MPPSSMVVHHESASARHSRALEDDFGEDFGEPPILIPLTRNEFLIQQGVIWMSFLFFASLLWAVVMARL